MRVTEKGQVTIPKEIRDRYGIKSGSEVEFVATDKGAVLVVVKPKEDLSFREWADSVAGTLDLQGMTTDEYMLWLRGERNDLNPR
jgi:AbrB family looped-hinge helix DNA binding protein